MKLAKHIASTALWIGIATGIASAQVMKQMPSSALALVKVSDLEVTNKKVADLAAALGVSQMRPEMADPLAALLKEIGATEGVNHAGDLAAAYIDPEANNTTDDKSVLILMPVSDYQKFIGNFADAKPDGDLTQFHFKGDADLSYVAHWGDYAAVSPSREIVAKPPTDIIAVAGLTAKELDGKDIVFFGNLKALRPKMLAEIEKARTQAPNEIDKEAAGGLPVKGLDATKFAPVAKVIATRMLDIAQTFAQGADAATYSVNLSPDGIATTLMCEFEPDSTMAKYAGDLKNTDESLLSGLADGKYLIFGGIGAQSLAQPLGDFLTPIQASITGLGPDYASLNDWLNAVQKIITASAGSNFALIAPTQQPGQGALVQMLGVRHGDAKAIMAAAHQMADAQMTAMKVLGIQLPGGALAYVPAAKTVDGVAFDQIKADSTGEVKTPMEQQIAGVLAMACGPLGPSVLLGAVNDNTLLTEFGLDDAGISVAIAAAKAGDDPLAKTGTIKSVVAQLPAQRVAAIYLPLDLWASTGFGYAKQFGVDMGVNIPENLPPIGTTLATDGSAVRVDTYVPLQLMQALTAAGMQVYMKTQNIGQPPAGGAAPGGGL